MKHLIVEKIIDFVSAEELNESYLKLASEITTHIKDCKECRMKVRAFQNVYDQLKETAFEQGAGISLVDFKKDADRIVEAELSDKKELSE